MKTVWQIQSKSKLVSIKNASMKQKLFTLLALLITAIGNAQFYKIGDYNGKTLNVCKGQFVSSKFTSVKDALDLMQPAYANNENYTVTFCSGDPTRKIRANFYYIGLGAGDHLYVYDGPTTASPQIGNLTGTVQYPGVFTSTGTCLTFRFISDNTQDINKSYGWDAFLGCTPTDCVGNVPASDECINATEICNLGGYCGSTSGWFTRGTEAATIDKPGAFCAYIQNNSWLSFTASTTSASFDITASNCSDPSTGVQAAIFETANCTNFTLKSTCYNNAQGTFTLATTSPLTIGKKYYIMIDGFDGNDCEYTIKANTGVQTLSVTANNSNTLCTGQPLVLTATATGIGPFTYNWTPAPVSGQGTAVATFPAATGITYSCSVTGVCGSPTTVTYTPSVVVTPVVTAADSAHICSGGSGTTLTATLSAGSPTIDFKNVTTIAIPDNDLTGITSTINVGTITGTVGNQLLNVGINIKHGNVADLSISLKAPNGSIIDLYMGKATGANFTNTYFSATATAAITTGTAPFSDTYMPEQPFSGLSTSIVNGSWQLIVKDKKTPEVGLLTGWSLSFKNDYSYAWTPTTGLTGTGASVIANPAASTTYTATITDKAGCSGTKTIKVGVTNTPNASFTYASQNFCQNTANPFPVIAPGAVAGTFKSTPVGLVFVNNATGEIDLKTSLPGTYSITNEVAPVNGCAAINVNPFTLTIHAEPKLDNPNTAVVCSGVPLNIALTGNAISTYSWIAEDNVNTSGESYITAQNTNTINDVIINNTTAPAIVKYNITLTSIAACLNTVPQTIAVTVNPNPVADTSALVIDASSCGTKSGSVTGIAVASGIAPLKYVWQDASGNTVGTTLNLSNAAPGTYILTITDANGCSTKIGAGKNLNIISLNKVHAFFTANPTTVEMPLPVQYTNASTGALNYNWSFGDGQTSTDINPSHSYQQLGDFSTCLMADDGAKCFDTVCINIKVFINSAFIIPNVFTPNDDGINDVFGILGKGIASLHAEVFNRWGQKEYEWDTPNGGWDGRSASGHSSPAGTYFVIIKAKGMDGKDLLEKGSFTLLR